MSEDSVFKDIACRYFKNPGPKNTAPLMESVAKRAAELDIQKILVATSSGRTALEAYKIIGTDREIIAVTYVTGFRNPDENSMSDEIEKDLNEKGIKILRCQHAFGGIGRAVRNKLSTYQLDEIIAFTLRVFGQGTKVAVELALMAADAGLIRTDEEVISIGGTGKGADTALIIQPANSFRFFDLKVKEIVSKPHP
jgi:hypothetical protein